MSTSDVVNFKPRSASVRLGLQGGPCHVLGTDSCHRHRDLPTRRLQWPLCGDRRSRRYQHYRRYPHRRRSMLLGRLHRPSEYRMVRLRQLPESHFVNRIGWLKSSSAGANDGIPWTASLIVGVAAAAATQTKFYSWCRGTGGGACRWPLAKMCPSARNPISASGSVCERTEFNENLEFELDELTEIYDQTWCRSNSCAGNRRATDGKRCLERSCTR